MDVRLQWWDNRNGSFFLGSFQIADIEKQNKSFMMLVNSQLDLFMIGMASN